MSNYQNWAYTRNPFTYPLAKSYIRTLKIVSAHCKRLEAYGNDPELDILYQRLFPVFTAYKTNYALWIAAVARRKRRTQEVADKLKELSSTLIEDWDIRIQLHYRRSTASYKELMSGRRKSYQRGSIDRRIAQLEAFAELLSEFPVLSDIKQEVDDFYTTLDGWRKEQEQWKDKTRLLAATLRGLMPQLARVMFQNLGSLIILYPDSPGSVVRMFNMTLIRSVSNDRTAVEEEVLEEEALSEFDESLFEDDSPISILEEPTSDLPFN